MGMNSAEKMLLLEFEEEKKREWNKLMLAHIGKIRKIKKPSPQFPTTIEKACEEYFALCEADGIKPSVAGLSLALGVSREVLLSWVNGDISIECADTIKHYFSLLEVFDETALKDNRVNGLVGIFNMKNNYNYKDQVEVKNISEKEISTEEIERKYGERHAIVGEIKEVEIQPAEISKPKKKSKKDKSSDVPF